MKTRRRLFDKKLSSADSLSQSNSANSKSRDEKNTMQSSSQHTGTTHATKTRRQIAADSSAVMHGYAASAIPVSSRSAASNTRQAVRLQPERGARYPLSGQQSRQVKATGADKHGKRKLSSLTMAKGKTQSAKQTSDNKVMEKEGSPHQHYLSTSQPMTAPDQALLRSQAAPDFVTTTSKPMDKNQQTREMKSLPVRNYTISKRLPPKLRDQNYFLLTRSQTN